MVWPVIMHINACEQGQTVDEVCKNCSRWGFDGVEFRRKTAGFEDVDSYLDAISKAVEKYRIKHVLFGSPGLQKHTGSRTEKEMEMEELIRFFEQAARRFQLTVCNIFAGPVMNADNCIAYSQYTRHGSFTAGEEQWEWAAGSFRLLGELARQLGFVLALETHMCYLNDTLEATARLINKIDHPAVGMNLDYGNLVYFSDPPSSEEAVKKAGEKLYYVHLKNSLELDGGYRIPAGLGEGDINNREYLKILKKARYTGPVCIEVPRSGDREWYVKKDIVYLKSLMEEI